MPFIHLVIVAGSRNPANHGDNQTVAQFLWRGRRVTIKASVNGYAAAWLRHHPWNSKGQITAVEVGLLPFDGAFLGQIMLENGETVLERVQRSEMLALPPGD